MICFGPRLCDFVTAFERVERASCNAIDTGLRVCVSGYVYEMAKQSLIKNVWRQRVDGGRYYRTICCLVSLMHLRRDVDSYIFLGRDRRRHYGSSVRTGGFCD